MKQLIIAILTTSVMSATALSQGVPEKLLAMGTYVAKYESTKEENKFLTVYFGVERHKKFAILRELKVGNIRYISLTTGKYKYEDGGLVLKDASYSSCKNPAETSLWKKIGTKVEIHKKRDGTVIDGGSLFTYLFGKRSINFEPAAPEAAYLITLDTIEEIDSEGLNMRPVCFKEGMKGIIE